MNEERRRILEMLSTGKITTEEADRLLAALGNQQMGGSAATTSESAVKAAPKYLRVMVEDHRKEGTGKGPTQVNVRVPMQLLRAGVRLAGLIPQSALNQANEAMHEKGVLFDLGQIKPENLEELVNELRDLTVDVDDNGTKVKVFCE